MAQHLAHFTLSGLPHLNGAAVVTFVGKDGRTLFPTDRDEAFGFRTLAAATKAAASVERKIRSAAARQH